MKIKMKSVAALLLAFSAMLSFYGCKDDAPAETTAAETEAPEERIEKVYDDYGIITNEYCYLGDELIYSVDYVYNDVTGTVQKFMFEGEKDENGNSVLIQSERYEVNELGQLKYYCLKDPKNVLLTETEYSYYGDLVTVWKKTTINYDGKGSYTAEKEVYDEEGKLTDLYTYEENKEVSHTVYTYDENGNRSEAAA